MPDTRVVRGGPGALLAATSAAVALVGGAGTALARAGHEIARATGATGPEVSWAVGAYALAVAVLALPLGIAARRWGRRTALVLGLAVLAVCSVWSGLVADPTTLVVLRGLAGAGAAAVVPAALSVLLDAHPAEGRPSAVAVWVAVAGAGALVGLVLADVLLSFAWWGSLQVVSGLLAAGVAGVCLAVVPPSWAHLGSRRSGRWTSPAGARVVPAQHPVIGLGSTSAGARTSRLSRTVQAVAAGALVLGVTGAVVLVSAVVPDAAPSAPAMATTTEKDVVAPPRPAPDRTSISPVPAAEPAAAPPLAGTAAAPAPAGVAADQQQPTAAPATEAPGQTGEATPAGTSAPAPVPPTTASATSTSTTTAATTAPTTAPTTAAASTPVPTTPAPATTTPAPAPATTTPAPAPTTTVPAPAPTTTAPAPTTPPVPTTTVPAPAPTTTAPAPTTTTPAPTTTTPAPTTTTPAPTTTTPAPTTPAPTTPAPTTPAATPTTPAQTSTPTTTTTSATTPTGTTATGSTTPETTTPAGTTTATGTATP
ncbi:MFS transporter [Geodermatophilus sp. URMC 62]|uniref:MFS transporter n=1 Tax=Geodermatophilus sp. URMC 62 TaxID=3423414 RepID=UPI00406C5213